MVQAEELKQMLCLKNMTLLTVFYGFLSIFEPKWKSIVIFRFLVSMGSLIKEAVANETALGVAIRPYIQRKAQSKFKANSHIMLY